MNSTVKTALMAAVVIVAAAVAVQFVVTGGTSVTDGVAAIEPAAGEENVIEFPKDFIEEESAEDNNLIAIEPAAGEIKVDIHEDGEALEINIDEDGISVASDSDGIDEVAEEVHEDIHETLEESADHMDKPVEDIME